MIDIDIIKELPYDAKLKALEDYYVWLNNERKKDKKLIKELRNKENCKAWHLKRPDYYKEYYAKNREKLKNRTINYQKTHPEKTKVYRRNYYLKNRLKIILRSKEYYWRHKKR